MSSSTTNNSRWVTLGKLSFPSSGQTAAKSSEFLLFQGLFNNGRLATIKRVRKDISVIEQRKLKQIQHPNIVRYYATETDDDFNYIATELFVDTMETVATRGYKGPSIGSNKIILEHIANALFYLHNQNIIHGNVNPRAVVLCSTEDPNKPPVIKLADFEVSGGRDGWKSPEYLTDPECLNEACDVFSLGILFAFLLSNGQHPFGSPHMQNSNILFGFYHLDPNLDLVTLDLITQMLEQEPIRRITLKDALNHPFFWNGEKAIAFITKVVDSVLKPILATAKDENQIIKQVVEIERPIIRGFWSQYLTPCVRALVDRKSYDGKTLVGLLFAIRDCNLQYSDQLPEVKAEFGDKPEGYWAYWSSRFPDLLFQSWKIFVIHV